MLVKTYRGATVQDALHLARTELNGEMVVLHTRNARRGLFGFLRQPQVEVTVAVEPPAPPPSLAGRLQLPPRAPAPLPEPEFEPRRLAPSAGRTGPALAPAWQNEPITDGVARLVQTRLVSLGIERAEAAELAAEVARMEPQRSWKPLRQAAEVLMTRHIGPAKPIAVAPGQMKVVSLVGPTGVGKTTTLAKLAAHLKLGEGRNVALITADTYRIAAVEQLRTYCDILRVPLEVVEDLSQVPTALQAVSRADVVLVDTAGRSHRNQPEMKDLQRLLAMLNPDEVHLVLDLNASTEQSLVVARHFSSSMYNRLLFTKLDESVSPGVLYNLCRRLRQPLSYVTTGQSVPEDIEPADPTRLSHLIMGGAL